MKALIPAGVRHPLYYWTLPARQNARWAFWRRARAVGRCAVLIVVWTAVVALAAYGAVSLGAQVFHFLVMP